MRLLPEKTNLTLHTERTWHGMPVNTNHGPLIREYLPGIYEALGVALDDYRRVAVVRVDLHFPLQGGVNAKGAISRFRDSLKAKVAEDLKRRKRGRRSGRVHECTPRIIWVREWSAGAPHPHYHVAVLLNYHEYWRLGEYEPGQGTLGAMISEAWSSALGLSPEASSGLVEFCNNTLTLLDRNRPTFHDDYKAVFFRLSYFAKVKTKRFGDGERNFGICRVPRRSEHANLGL